jgi:hypothetical protein
MCVLVFSGVSARAAIEHEYLSQITEVPATGPHGEAVPSSGALTGVKSLAADGGNVWLAEHVPPAAGVRESFRDFRIDEFSASSGAFVSQLPQVPGVTELDLGVAVGHVGGEAHVYVPGFERESGASVVLVFGALGGGLLAKWTGAATPGKAFDCLPCGGQRQEALVAVDNSTSFGDWAAGDVYVADPGHSQAHNVVDVFEPEGINEGKLVGELTGVSPTEPFTRVEDVAVSSLNGDVLVVDGEVVDMFKPAAIAGQYEFVGVLPGPPPSGTSVGIFSVAIDGTDGDIYVVEQINQKPGEESAVVSEFGSTGVYLGKVTGAGSPTGHFGFVNSVAVDSTTHRVFVGGRNKVEGADVRFVDVFSPNIVVPDVTTGSVSGLQPESVALNGTVNPVKAGVATCQFVYGTSTLFGQVAPCSSVVAEGESPVPVQAMLTGLQPDTTYYYRLEASNANGTNSGEESQNGVFTTTGPGLREESVSNVASSSVTFDATIDPHGAPTSYFFQYGTSAAYGKDVPGSSGVSIGSGEGSVDVSQHVQEGLLAGTTYHYRVVAVSEVEPGTVEMFAGADGTFRTQPAGGGLVLSDGRAWELVTPPDKRGAEIFAIGQTSDEGAVIQAAVGGGALAWVADDPTEAVPHGYTNLLQGFSARGPDGWVSRDIAIPHPGATGVSVGFGQEYRFFSGDLSRGVVQPFGPLIPELSKEASEPTAYLSSEYLNGNPTEPCLASCFRPLVTGAPGYANVPAGTVFGEEVEGKCTSADGLLLCGPKFFGATPDLSHIVLESKVALTSTPVPPNSEILYEWSAGRLTLVSVLPGPSGAVSGVFDGSRHGISDDGSRIFWGEGNDLFVRDVPRGETLLIGREANFEGASADGSVVFFSGQVCEIKSNGTTGALECRVETLVKNVLGYGVVGASDDGSWVYFVGPEVLAPGGVPGGYNLYVRHAGVTRFIASVSTEDADKLTKNLTVRPARVSPNGRWFTFMSQFELAGGRTRDAISGKSDEEVYLYDAEGNEGAGRLVCASCNPFGARPVGEEYGTQDTTLHGGSTVWPSSAWLASNIPGWTPYRLGASIYQSHFLSGSGRLFFNSHDALVPQDVNGTWDVYQYEPAGVGGCDRSKVTFSEGSQGCVDLISSGGSSEESGFLDASETGGDVFFLTSAKLAGQDRDTALDVYDAHECRSSAPCFAAPPVEPPVCDTGDACKAAPTPQPAVFGSPSSATFTGAGNLTATGSKPAVTQKGLTRAQKLARALRACRKKTGKRRAVCVRRAKARYAAARTHVSASKRSGR